MPLSYLAVVGEGSLVVKLPEGVWVKFFFIVDCQSWNGRHWANNPGLRLDGWQQRGIHPRDYLHMTLCFIIVIEVAGSSSLTIKWMFTFLRSIRFRSRLVGGCKLHKEACKNNVDEKKNIDISEYRIICICLTSVIVCIHSCTRNGRGLDQIWGVLESEGGGNRKLFISAWNWYELIGRCYLLCIKKLYWRDFMPVSTWWCFKRDTL